MFKHLLLLAFVPALIYGQATNVRSCTGVRPRPHEVRVRGCTQMPCVVRRGQDAIMDVDFAPHQDSATLEPSVFVLGGALEYPLPEHLRDACQHIYPNGCPLAAGTNTTYNFIFTVQPFYPLITIGVEVNLTNNHGSVVTCFIVDVSVRL